MEGAADGTIQEGGVACLRHLQQARSVELMTTIREAHVTDQISGPF